MTPEESDAPSPPPPPVAQTAHENTGLPPPADPPDTEAGGLTGAGAASALAHLINLERIRGLRRGSD